MKFRALRGRSALLNEFAGRAAAFIKRRESARSLVCAIFMFSWESVALSQETCDAECLARFALDPLADVNKFLLTNAIAFSTDAETTSTAFTIQPFYAIPTERGVNVILRGIVPIVGVAQDLTIPQLGSELITGDDTEWGLSDIVVQALVSPQTKDRNKWGLGPQFSLRTRTSNPVGAAGWGAGVAGAFFGSSGAFSYGAIGNHLWGQDGFNLSSLQPIVFQTVEPLGGAYVGYNNTITYNWNTDTGSRWQVPVGLTIGKVFAIGAAHAIDVSIGGYALPVKPVGGADWQLRMGLSLLKKRK